MSSLSSPTTPPEGSDRERLPHVCPHRPPERGRKGAGGGDIDLRLRHHDVRARRNPGNLEGENNFLRQPWYGRLDTCGRLRKGIMTFFERVYGCPVFTSSPAAQEFQVELCAC